MSASKKTLADIQKEEEQRKTKAASAAAATAAQPASTPGGKRYADLASKPATSASTPGPAWSTVGAGGKVKIPTGPAMTTTPARSVSNPAVTPARSRPAARPTTSSQVATPSAQEEFSRWAKATLAKDLNKDINGE